MHGPRLQHQLQRGIVDEGATTARSEKDSEAVERIVRRVARRGANLGEGERHVDLIRIWSGRADYLHPFAARRDHNWRCLQLECSGVAEVRVAGIGPRKA